jgi:hypothetical protein
MTGSQGTAAAGAAVASHVQARMAHSTLAGQLALPHAEYARTLCFAMLCPDLDRHSLLPCSALV